MHPELFRIGPFAVHSYGVMLAISFIVGIYVAVKKAEKRGIKGRNSKPGIYHYSSFYSWSKIILCSFPFK